MQTAAEAIAAIEQIDKLIDANRVALQMRLRLSLSVTGHGLDIYAWHNAYARCPDLRIRRDALSLQAGRLQLVRDAAINREYAAEQRAAKRRRTTEQRRRDRATAVAA